MIKGIATCLKFEEFLEWYFSVDEVSAGVYKAIGKDKLGRSVEFIGTDPDSLLERCKKAAKEMVQPPNKNRLSLES